MSGKNSQDGLTRTSRYLALVLRHKPQAAGITLDSHGWADVRQLLEGVNRTRHLTMEELEEIVRTDEKGRYAFNEDRTLIRANQGHSVPVDVELEELAPPEVLWHGKGEQSTAGIERSGLVSRGRLYVHLSADPETARKVGLRHGRVVLYQVRTGDMARDGFRFYQSVNGVWLTHYVPVNYLDRKEG